MNERDAQEIIRIAESNWHMDLGPARAMWRSELMLYNAEVATLALAELGKKQPYKITIADLVEAIRTVEDRGRRQIAEDRRREEDARALKEGKRGYATPEWVHVWVWNRNQHVTHWEDKRVPHKQRKLRSFPQQQDWGDPDTRMTTTEYETLRQKWVDAGSPKEKSKMFVNAL